MPLHSSSSDDTAKDQQEEEQQGLRQRRGKEQGQEHRDQQDEVCKVPKGSVVTGKDNVTLKHSYWFTRIVFLRGLALVYLVAFAVALDQNTHLIGDRGLLPLKQHLSRLKSPNDGFIGNFMRIPTLLWLWEPWTEVDPALNGIALAGIVLSSAVLITGGANAVAMAALWLLYHSLVNVGQTWYSFGWESQLLETGFLAVWIVPVLKWSPLPEGTPTPWIAVAGYRWLIMRIMIGAGLIKVRGDRCWLDLTCMHYFYETQPNPNPVSYWTHWAPGWWHNLEVLGNHWVELASPFLTLLPFRWAAMTNGAFQILFQAILISTGNLSFLNWLTMMPSFWYLDDDVWAMFFSSKSVQRVKDLESKRKLGKASAGSSLSVRKAFNLAIACLIAVLSYPIVVNLVSPNQIMNTSFEPFRVVNTYGAFGSVTKTRTEVVLEGTRDEQITSSSVWLEYEFKCKPGDVSRRPCLLSPNHSTPAWPLWLAAFPGARSHPGPTPPVGKHTNNEH